MFLETAIISHIFSAFQDRKGKQKQRGQVTKEYILPGGTEVVQVLEVIGDWF